MSTSADQRILFSGGQVFDSTTSSFSEADVVIQGQRILEVGTGLDGDVEVGCSGHTLLPGLFDCHVHVTSSGTDLMAQLQRPFSYQFYEAEQNLLKTLECGITTVRDASGADLGVQEAVDNGLIKGPRMQISVTALSQTGGHGDGWMASGHCIPFALPHPGRPPGIVDGPEEARKKTREVIRAGANVIKVFTSGGVLSPRDDPRHGHFRDDELLAIVTEAHAAGIEVMAHAQATEGIKAAVRTGIRSIEHGIFLDREAIEMMLAKGTWLVPTLVAPHAVIDAVEAGAMLPQAMIDKARAVMETHFESFKLAVRSGVKIAMGTDSGVGPHGTNLRELELMSQGGMTPGQVLSATTLSAAELMGVSGQLGSIEAGKLADLVVVRGDATDFANLKTSIRAVYKAGKELIRREAVLV